jgi:iron complex outermembrane receptor protein
MSAFRKYDEFNWHLRYTILLYSVIFFPLQLLGQMSLENDTVKISEVTITRNIINTEPAGFKNTIIDSVTLSDYSNTNLSEMLSGRSMIFIKSYGMGGVASPSFRGTGASQTLINWNGININSPMLGQSDLSLIPIGLVDDVHVYYGGASMQLNNGGIGGAINIETKPTWEKGTLVSLNAGMGSFGEYSGLIKVKTGNDHIQSVTKGYLLTDENNFRYLDNENGSPFVWKTRTNSQVSQQGFLQELYLNNSDNVASARIWYQLSDRHLPPTMLSTDENEQQFDESLRIMLNDNLTRSKSNYSFTGAWLMGRLNYSDKLAMNNSRSLSETLVMKAERESHPWRYTNLKISLSDEFCTVKTNLYDRKENRNTSTLTASMERVCIDRFGITVLLSEILLNHKFLIPDFSTGLQFRLIEDKEYFLKASISRNSRIPTMNDLYYPYSGNADLRNEYAFTYELTYKMNQKISSLLSTKAELSLFHSSIKDMIQWNPVNSNFWTPGNINRVSSTGLESEISMTYSVNKFTASLYVGYSMTKSFPEISDSPGDNSVGKQLIYIPINQANSSVRFAYGEFYTSLTTSLTGLRYTIKDDLAYLPYYIITNSITGIKLPLHNNSIDFSLNINNLFDYNYQSIAYYPMPGRSYFVKILFQLFK